jgi:hypothetical protein
MLEIYGETLKAESGAGAGQHWFAGRGCAPERGKIVDVCRPEKGKTVARWGALQLTRNAPANPSTTS